MGLGVVVAVDILHQSLRPLQGVEDTLVMYRVWEHRVDGLSVILIHVGDDDLWLVAFGFECLQESASYLLAAVGIDVNVQQYVPYHGASHR